MGGWTDPGAASVPQDSENEAVRVEGAGVEDSEGEQEGISSSENTPGQDRKPQGLGYQQKGIDSVSGGAHHQLSPQLCCSFPGGQWENPPFGPSDMVHFAAAQGLESSVNIRRACLLRLWQSWLHHRADICLSLKAY